MLLPVCLKGRLKVFLLDITKVCGLSTYQYSNMQMHTNCRLPYVTSAFLMQTGKKSPWKYCMLFSGELPSRVVSRIESLELFSPKMASGEVISKHTFTHPHHGRYGGCWKLHHVHQLGTEFVSLPFGDGELVHSGLFVGFCFVYTENSCLMQLITALVIAVAWVS